jgi:hypothetical protein
MLTLASSTLGVPTISRGGGESCPLELVGLRRVVLGGLEHRGREVQVDDVHRIPRLLGIIKGIFGGGREQAVLYLF